MTMYTDVILPLTRYV